MRIEGDISGSSSDRDVTLSRSGFLFLRLRGNEGDFYCLIGISLQPDNQAGAHKHLLAKSKDFGLNAYLKSIISPNNFPARTSFLFWPNFTGCWTRFWCSSRRCSCFWRFLHLMSVCDNKSVQPSNPQYLGLGKVTQSEC